MHEKELVATQLLWIYTVFERGYPLYNVHVHDCEQVVMSNMVKGNSMKKCSKILNSQLVPVFVILLIIFLFNCKQGSP